MVFITLRLSLDEYRLIHRAADAAGLGVEEWCRRVLVESAEQELDEQERAEIAKTFTEGASHAGTDSP